MDSNSATGVHTSLPFSGTYSIGSTEYRPHDARDSCSGHVHVPGCRSRRRHHPIYSERQRRQSRQRLHSQGELHHQDHPCAARRLLDFRRNGADAQPTVTAAAGTFQSDNNGAWTHSRGATPTTTARSPTTRLGTGNFTSIDPVTQRGTANMTANSVTTNYSFYPVSTTEMIMLSTDPVSSYGAARPVFSQQSAAEPATLNASITVTTVAELQGLASSNTVPYAALAFATFDGTGGCHRFHRRKPRRNAQRQQLRRLPIMWPPTAAPL